MLALVACLAANAQFEKGKTYIGASLSGIWLSYNGSEEAKFGLQVKGGYLLADNLMAVAQFGYDKQHEQPYNLSVGVGGRYYIIQNGLYLGAGCDFHHRGEADNGKDYNDFMPTVQLGYAFFISHTVTIEPELYYSQSFKNHKDFSTFGLRIGIGVYL